MDTVRSYGTGYSTRLNIPRILSGERFFTGVEGLMPSLPIWEIARGKGHPEWIHEGKGYLSESAYLIARSDAAQSSDSDVDDTARKESHSTLIIATLARARGPKKSQVLGNTSNLALESLKSIVKGKNSQGIGHDRLTPLAVATTIIRTARRTSIEQVEIHLCCHFTIL
jgi:hypothetical protein